MKEVLLVFVGGGFGSVLRLLAAKWFNPMFVHFPFGTFLANLISCLILGIFSSYVLAKSGDSTIKPLIMIGLCGGFSTFSTFSLEVFEMLKNQQYLNGSLYVLISLIVCVIGIFLGMTLGSKIFA